jgi:hypothetical protein
VKTDQDIYIRLDMVLSELATLLLEKPTQAVTYWSGFVHHHMMPIQDKDNKNADTSYPLPLFPPYTVGALYVLSSHLAQVIASVHSSPGGGSSKLSAIANEDQTLGFILDHFHFSPKHDRRIQQWNVCSKDMIAFHFSDGEVMSKIHSGVTQHNDPCFYVPERKAHCPLCYEECAGNTESKYDWRVHWTCTSRGATLRRRSDDLFAKQRRRRGLTASSALALSSDGAVRVSTGILRSYDHSKTVVTRSRVQQTDYSTTFSCDPNYNWSETSDTLEPRFILIWTTAPSSFTLKQHRVLESVIFHHPKAQILIFSNSLPCNFFTTLSSLPNVNLKIVRYNLETLSEGLPGSNWIARIKEWEKKSHFYAHSADFLRMLLLYRYGGVYMDFDVVLLHRLHLENTVIGEYCDDLSLEYCLFLPELGSLITSTPFADRHYRFYIPIGMLIFKPRHPLVYKTLSYFDTSYDPDLWPCGTIFLTKAVQTVCLEVSSTIGASSSASLLNGKCDDIWMLPPEAVYPIEWHSRSVLTTK